MKRIINRTVKMVLDSLGYEYARKEMDATTLFAFLHVEADCEYLMSLNVDEKNGVIAVTGFYPGSGRVTGENYVGVSRTIDILNYECPVGTILINPTNGELIYRITHCLDGETVNEGFVRIILGMVIERMKTTVETLGRACRESGPYNHS